MIRGAQEGAPELVTAAHSQQSALLSSTGKAHKAILLWQWNAFRKIMSRAGAVLPPCGRADHCRRAASRSTATRSSVGDKMDANRDALHDGW